MPVKTGLPQHIVDSIIAKIPENFRTVAEINRTIDYHFGLRRPRAKRMKVTTIEMVQLFTKDHLTLREISNKVGLSATAISKRLKNVGVKANDGTWVVTKCAFCQATIKRTRSRFRKNEDNYCNQECYAADLESPGYKQWRQGSRIARAIVSQYIQIPYEAIVHHKDGNDRNNDIGNLLLLANQGDHMRVHRSSKTVEPLWDGATDV